ncbi:probable G-protein coupled receptor 156 [Monodelphis domestica]|uniref:probable G-protein coupled receptor 156 n=1 Tax=Monodelphis domestica TaxID=13616 RepID=UPI0024E1A45E|nr:probable G-protein coupled receptor 156 [Monodelphis domestica]XP_007493812.2 probable G-protein coupled receptor 156 [Monodelphis domestica]
MEPELNCSDLCHRIPSQEVNDRPLQDFCGIAITSSDLGTEPTSLSSALLGIVWTSLSGGLLLVLYFLIFTVRCRNNRIVKMSSPNLNILTLMGSGLTYASAYLFGVPDQDIFLGPSMTTLIQIRLSLLCVGSSLIFGPILGKSWRLYKVFTQRVPDKRVIIKDLQLLGLVAILVMVDVILLMIWVLSDPIQCLQILRFTVRMTERDITCSMTKTYFCASLYSDLWITLFLGYKGIVLLYGAYLAGRTDHVSSPPVNQSLTIMVGANLVVLAAGLLFLVTRFFHDWPNLVFGLTAGGIFVCTTTINCFIFIPQLKQWKPFDEENQTVGHMAKYFSSPSRSFHAPYSEEQIYHLIGEKNSMKKLLTEKNAVIESLQEQVNNAKEKLMKLMSGECTNDHPSGGATPVFAQGKASPTEADQKQVHGGVGAEGLFNSLSDSGGEPCPVFPDTQCGPALLTSLQSLKDLVEDQNSSPQHQEQISNSEDMLDHLHLENTQKQQVSQSGGPKAGDQGLTSPSPNLIQDPKANISQRQKQLRNSETFHEQPSKINYVSSEMLQEVLQELSLGKVTNPSCSPSGPQCLSPSMHQEDSAAHSPQKRFPSNDMGISPYMVRRRRAAQRASMRFLGSVPSQTWCLMNKTVSRTQSGLKVQSENRFNQELQAGDPEGQKFISWKPSLLTPARGSLSPPAENRQSHSEDNRTRVRVRDGVPNQSSCSGPTEHQVGPLLSSNPPSLLGLERPQLNARGRTGWPALPSLCDYGDSESSSSDEPFCRCHRPYCDICFQSSSDSGDSSTSENDPEPPQGRAHWAKMYARSQPIVNFREDLKPTLV